MEQLNIGFKYGIRRTPSIGNEGELSELVNLIPKNGELVNIKHPKIIADINHPNNKDKRLVVIHKVNDTFNYIYYDGDEGKKLYINNSTDSIQLQGKFVKIIPIGNTLIVSTESNIEYLLWSDNTYTHLGDIPEIEMGFFLDSDGWFYCGKPGVNTGIIRISGSTSPAINMTEERFSMMMSQAFKAINHIQNVMHRFCLPFFVRYGIELYDGSIVHQSSPILMVINAGNSPIAYSSECDVNEGSVYNFKVAMRYAQLKYRTVKPQWDNWKDIIKGVVVAISRPIYKFNESQAWDELNKGFIGSELIATGKQKDYSYLFPKEISCLINGTVVEEETWSNVSGFDDNILIKYTLPMFSESKYKDNILNNSNFYIISHIGFDDIKYGQDTVIDVDDMQLSSIETLPTMPDDFNSHNKFCASTSFVYNNRLSIANIKETLLPGKQLLSPVGGHPHNQQIQIFTYIKEDNREFVTKEITGYDSLLHWIFYPHTGAYKMIVYIPAQTGYKKYTIPLTIHPYLNGAYWIKSETLNYETVSAATETATTEPIYRPNYIYTSEQDNPFFFPASLQETIGSGTIKAVTTSAKALSEGQFGQFPLYAFCSDGIWALSVSDNGTYATTNPVSRDVCENINSIAQIDSAVVFATAQGLKLLTQSNVETLSLAMEGENVDESQFFDADEPLKVADTESFVKMLEGCTVMYDYANLMLHVYPSDCQSTGKHYVYSFSSNEWSSVVSADSKVQAVVPGYPYSTLQLQNGDLMQYDNTEDTTRYNGILLTRPVDMGNPLAMKIISDMRTIYKKMSANAKCSVAIFASNDGYQWTKVNSLRKHSWKYYRFRIKTALTNLEALTGLVALYDVRRNNKMR